MIQITPHMRIFLATEPVDFRKGIDGLVSVCRKVLNEDPFSGGMFIFRNKRRTTKPPIGGMWVKPRDVVEMM